MSDDPISLTRVTRSAAKQDRARITSDSKSGLNSSTDQDDTLVAQTAVSNDSSGNSELPNSTRRFENDDSQKYGVHVIS
jgi:hypothetical protein